VSGSAVTSRSFEGLLKCEGCVVTPELEAQLRTVGYDGTALQEAYSAQVWLDAVDAVRRHLFPLLSIEQGSVEVGRRFAAGLGHTTVGSVFKRVAPLFGLERTMLAVPRYLHVVRRDLEVTLLALGHHHWRLSADDAQSNPHFIAGCLRGLVELFDRPSRAVVHQQGSRFEVELFCEYLPQPGEPPT
jgi:uncharacterized protein (TIGR02265 family)